MRYPTRATLAGISLCLLAVVFWVTFFYLIKTSVWG